MSSATKDVNSFSTPNKALPKQNEANTFWGHDQLRVYFLELTPWAKKRCPWRFSVICFDSLKGRHQSMSWHLELTPVVYSVIFLDSRWHKTWELPAFQFTNLFQTKIVKFDEFMSKKSTLMLTGWFKVPSLRGATCDNRELKQQRFWATDVNRKWTFCIIGQWFGWNSRVNRL